MGRRLRLGRDRGFNATTHFLSATAKLSWRTQRSFLRLVSHDELCAMFDESSQCTIVLPEECLGYGLVVPFPAYGFAALVPHNESLNSLNSGTYYGLADKRPVGGAVFWH